MRIVCLPTWPAIGGQTTMYTRLQSTRFAPKVLRKCSTMAVMQAPDTENVARRTELMSIFSCRMEERPWNDAYPPRRTNLTWSTEVVTTSFFRYVVESSLKPLISKVVMLSNQPRTSKIRGQLCEITSANKDALPARLGESSIKTSLSREIGFLGNSHLDVWVLFQRWNVTSRSCSVRSATSCVTTSCKAVKSASPLMISSWTELVRQVVVVKCALNNGRRESESRVET